METDIFSLICSYFVLLKKVQRPQVNQPSELSHQMQQRLLGVDLIQDLP